MSAQVISGPGAPSLDLEREAMHRQMLSGVAHDLKTPLASIIGSLDVYTEMHKKLSPEKQAELIKVALQEARRLDTFVTNILDMAKLENGDVKANSGPVEIGALLGHCVTAMSTHARRSVVDVRAVSGTVNARTDSALLLRALGLIIDNAVKYGGMPAEIWIEFGQDDSGYITIRDNGEGLPDDQLEAVFAKYVRLGKKNPQNAAGGGLGLAIVRAIMRLLNGDATAANHPNGGAVFTLRFPLT